MLNSKQNNNNPIYLEFINGLKYSDMNICSVSLWRKFRKADLIKCNYLKFAFLIPMQLKIELLIFKVTGRDFNFR